MPTLRTGGAEPGPSYQRMSLDLGDVIFVQKTLLDARQDFLAAGDADTATKIALIFDSFVTRIRTAANRTAVMAEREIIANIDATRVRPDTGRAGPKLRDSIETLAWDPTPSVATGTVAIGLKSKLDRLPYWRVQEYGHHFAHAPKGFFLNAGYTGPASVPNPALFRVHPLFVPSGRGRKFRNPPTVQARHFLRDGTDKAVAYWKGETAKAIAEAVAQLNRLLARRGHGARTRTPPRRR